MTNDMHQTPTPPIVRTVVLKKIMGLAHPVASKVLTRHGSQHFKIGAASMQGFRTDNAVAKLLRNYTTEDIFRWKMRTNCEMEDAHTINTSMDHHKPKGFFGVYDGHNGEVCAHWSAANLWKYIDDLTDHTEEAIQKACLEADKEFLTNDPGSSVGNMAGGSGCTAVFCIVDTATEDGYEVTVANIGDSRALIGRNGQTVELTEDHKPTNPGEMKRIQNAGGFVQAARVDGQLALSRAMGDAQYKQNSQLPAHEQKVIPVPDISKEKLKPGDFLLVCCDGIFESFSNDEAVRFVADKLKTMKDDPAMIMALLLDAVLQAGSKDNMTALLILPEDGTSYHREKDEFLPGYYHEHRTNSTFADAYANDARRNGYSLEEALVLLEKNTKEGYYKAQPVQSRGFLFPFFAAAAASVKDDDDDDDVDEDGPPPTAPSGANDN